jgi:hypothetical protein
MAQRFSEFGPSVGSDRTHLSEGDGGKATAN